MKKISCDTLRKELSKSDNVIFRYNCEMIDEADTSNSEFLEGENFLYFKEYEDGNYGAYVWFTSNDNFDKTVNELVKDEKCEVLLGATYNFTPKSIEKYASGIGLARKGQPCKDIEVQELNETHSQMLLDFCVELKKAGKYEVEEAESFEYIVEEKLYPLYGIIEQGKIIGAVYFRAIDDVKVGVLSEIAVLPSAQGRGYGKRLIKKALSLKPDYDYFYRACRFNDKSIALAKACGFEFCGYSNIRLKVPD